MYLNSQTYKNSYNKSVIINTEGENSNNLELRSSDMSESVTFTFPEGNGDLDEVLTTDGNGNLTWTSKTSSTLTNDLYFDVFDNTGGQNFTTSTITLNLNTERQNPNSSIFTNSTSSITINVSDKFLIMYRVGVNVSSGTNRSDFIATLERYNGVSWSEVSGFRTHGYNRQATEGMNTSSAFGVVDVTAGYSYRVRIWRDSGSDVLTTIANGSSLFVMAVKNAGSGPVGPAGADGADGAQGEKGDKGDPGTASDFINVYDGVGDGVTISTTTVTVPLNTVRNESGTIFNLENDNLVITADDVFMIEYTTAFYQNGGNNRSTWNTWLESNTGSGFSEIPGTRSAGYSRQDSDGQDNSNGRAIVDVETSSTFRIVAERVSGVGIFYPLQNATSMVAYTLRGGEQGPAGASGTITGAQGEKGDKGDQGEPGTASDFINVYDGVGDGVTITTTTVTIPLNTIRNESGTIFNLENDNLIISADDIFMIEYTTALYQNGGNNRSTWNTWLESNTGSGFSEIPGTRSAGYSRQDSDGQDNSNGRAIVDVETSSTFRIVAQRISGVGEFYPLQNATSMVAYTLRGGEQGPAGASGTITGAQGEKGDKGDQGEPGTASDFINVYDGVGGQVTIDPGPETIPLNTTGNYSGTIFNLNSDNLEINATDTYMFQYSLTLIQTGGNNRSTWRSWLESNTGSGFTEVLGTRSGAYSRQTSDGEDNAFGQAVISVNNSATFRLRAERTNGVGEFEPIQYGTSMIVYTLRGGEQGPAGESGTVTMESGTFIEGQGSINELAYFSSSTTSRTITSSANLFWNNANKHLGISNSSPSYNLDVAQDIGIGNTSNSGTLSFTAVNGLDTYRVNFTTSASTSENIDYVLPVEQGVESSALMNDGSGNLYWGSPSSIASSIRFPIYYTGTSDYDCELTDSYIICDNTGTTIAVNLPEAVNASGKVFFIKKVSPNGASHIVTVTPNGTDTIDGDADWELSKEYDAIMLISDGDETWHLMSKINN